FWPRPARRTAGVPAVRIRAWRRSSRTWRCRKRRRQIPWRVGHRPRGSDHRTPEPYTAYARVIVATPEGAVAMTKRRRRSGGSGRAPLFSPGRRAVARRDEQRWFWAAISAGMASEDAAVGAGMSQAVGTRLFRKAGGMPPAMFRPSAKPLSGRYLSFAEREEI